MEIVHFGKLEVHWGLFQDMKKWDWEERKEQPQKVVKERLKAKSEQRCFLLCLFRYGRSELRRLASVSSDQTRPRDSARKTIFNIPVPIMNHDTWKDS